MSGWWFFMLPPVGVFLTTGTLTLFFTLREKRLVWEIAPMHAASGADRTAAESAGMPASAAPYEPPRTEPEELPITPFAMQHGSALTQMGYTFLGAYRHGKGGVYRIRYDLLLSPDRQIWAAVESGSLAGMKLNNVSMISLGWRKDAPGTIGRRDASFAIISIINESAFEPDLTGNVEQRHFPGARPTVQEQLHRCRFATMDAIPFSDAPVEDLRRFRDRQAQALAVDGKIRFLDQTANTHRPTLTGGLSMYARTYSFMIGRRLYPHRWRVKRLP